MGADIDAIGQTADDEHIRTELTETADEAGDEVLAVVGATPCANDVDDVFAVEVGTAFIIKDDGGVVIFAQAGRVGVVVERQRLDGVLPDERHLGGSTLQRLVPVLQGLDETWRTVGQHVANVVAVVIDGLGTAQLAVELHCLLLVEARHAGEGNGIEDLLLVHGSMYLAKARS